MFFKRGKQGDLSLQKNVLTAAQSTDSWLIELSVGYCSSSQGLNEARSRCGDKEIPGIESTRSGALSAVEHENQ